ncbi:MAG: BsuPI-related putative proteinase inhibitor, partial [Kangiellaceae bacterium]|nr:BsuPI-related putative proteinase inhibitor [Kangiellaceae bacterium]
FYYLGILIVSFGFTGCTDSDSLQNEVVIYSKTTHYSDDTFIVDVELLDQFDQPSSLFNSGEEITVRLTITNQSNSQQQITYSSSQRVKAVVTARNDNQVLFDFDSAYLYAQVIFEQSLNASQSVSFEADFNSNQLGAGEYTLRSAMALFDIDHNTLLDGTDSQFEDSIDFQVQ